MTDRLLSGLLKELRASAARMCYNLINCINVQLNFKGRLFRITGYLAMRKSREANIDTILMMRHQ